MRKTKTELSEDGWKILKQEVFHFVPKIVKEFDLIFADPPFGLDGVLDLPSLVLEKGILKKDGILIIEHGKETDFEKNANFKEIRKYGGVNFSFFLIS